MAEPLITFYNRLSTNQLRATNMFEFEVTSGYEDVDNALKYITMYGEGLTLPTRSTQFVDVGFKGYTLPIPTVGQMEQQHTITIRADANGEIRRAFLAWQGHVWDPNISAGSVFTGDRRMNSGGTIRVKLLDNDMMTISEIYKIIGVKIESVGGLQVSNTDSSVSTFDTQFRSVWWEIEQGSVNAGAFANQV